MIEADLLIIGAGPAGMAAAGRAAAAGVSVLLLDEQPRAGGQIYRDVERITPSREKILGTDYIKGLKLTQNLEHSGTRHLVGATVWQISKDNEVTFTVDDVAKVARGKKLLLATGALERPMPLSGWTLPGVLNAGAGQILLKQSGMVIDNAVLVGSGPLVYLLAAQMCRAGTPPKALIETQTNADFFAAMRHAFGALQGWRYLAKGLGLLVEIRRAGVKRFTGATAIRIEGNSAVEEIHFNARGQNQRIACSTVLLHHGVIPNTQTARSVDVPHRWSKQQHAFVPEIDIWGRTSIPDIFICGDGGRIGGAEAASIEGELVALQIACDLNVLSSLERDQAADKLRRKLKRELAARPFIDRAYPPFSEALSPADETLVCRCEEISAADIRGYAKIGCLGPNQTKAFGRAGMGPCQGRYCGPTVTQILSEANNQSHDETGYYRIRSPLKPLTLGELSTLAEPKEKEE